MSGRAFRASRCKRQEKRASLLLKSVLLSFLSIPWFYYVELKQAQLTIVFSV